MKATYAQKVGDSGSCYRENLTFENKARKLALRRFIAKLEALFSLGRKRLA